MSPPAGARLGPYEILGALGAGGMSACGQARPSYDVAPDGRFVVVRGTEGQVSPNLVVTVNRLEEIKARVPIE